MSRNESTEYGATTHLGELLTGNGSDFHQGLIVVDGAVVPSALGVNPFATITALAERSVEGVAKKKGISIDFDTKNGILDLFAQPAFPMLHDKSSEDLVGIRNASSDKSDGIGFTEVMSGFVHIGDDFKDYEVAQRIARGRCESARLFLSIHSRDNDTLFSRDGLVTGTFTSGALLESPYMVLGGDFQLFNKDQRTPDTKNMTYSFDMVGSSGKKLHFSGYKILNDGIAFSPSKTWKASSTLYVTLTDPEKLEGKNVVGRGILTTDPRDFLSELATIKTTGKGLLPRVRLAFNFFGNFFKQLSRFFFAPFGMLQWPTTSHEDWTQKTSPNYTLKITASDGVKTILNIWDPMAGSPTRDTDILFVPVCFPWPYPIRCDSLMLK